MNKLTDVIIEGAESDSWSQASFKFAKLSFDSKATVLKSGKRIYSLSGHTEDFVSLEDITAVQEHAVQIENLSWCRGVLLRDLQKSYAGSGILGTPRSLITRNGMFYIEDTMATDLKYQEVIVSQLLDLAKDVFLAAESQPIYTKHLHLQ